MSAMTAVVATKTLAMIRSMQKPWLVLETRLKSDLMEHALYVLFDVNNSYYFPLHISENTTKDKCYHRSNSYRNSGFSSFLFRKHKHLQGGTHSGWYRNHMLLSKESLQWCIDSTTTTIYCLHHHEYAGHAHISMVLKQKHFFIHLLRFNKLHLLLILNFIITTFFYAVRYRFFTIKHTIEYCYVI